MTGASPAPQPYVKVDWNRGKNAELKGNTTNIFIDNEKMAFSNSQGILTTQRDNQRFIDSKETLTGSSAGKVHADVGESNKEINPNGRRRLALHKPHHGRPVSENCNYFI